MSSRWILLVLIGALLLSPIGWGYLHSQPAPGSFPGCVYNSSLPTLSNKQTTVLQCDVHGQLILH